MNDFNWYLLKNDMLQANCTEVSPFDFYRYIFPVGTFETKVPLKLNATGEKEIPDWDKADMKPNTILVKIRKVQDPNNPDKKIGKSIKLVITDDLLDIESAKDEPDCIMSPISYYGRSRSSKMADSLYAITIDLDFKEYKKDFILTLLHQMSEASAPASPTKYKSYLPPATFICNSGHGLHLYYVLDKPLKLYKNVVPQINLLRKVLTNRIWNGYITDLYESVQFQSTWQGFRIPGSSSKLGSKYPITAFKFGDRISIEELLKYIPKSKDKGLLKDYSCLPLDFKIDYWDARLTLDESQELYPKWYMERVVGGEPKKKWHVKRDLYDWWLNKIKEKKTVGHRYYCIRALVAYAVKCDIDYYELEADANSLLEDFDRITPDGAIEQAHFHQEDIDDALTGYNGDQYDISNRFKRQFISDNCAIEITPQIRRNGFKQEQHLEVARGIRDIKQKQKGRTNWREGNGRPLGSKDKNPRIKKTIDTSSKAQVIKNYLLNHPNASKNEITRATGFDHKTVAKWYDEIKKESNN